MNQILNYPTPISDGDEQFNFLLSERDRLREEEDDNNDDKDKRKQREKSTEREEKEKEAVERITATTTEYTYGYDLSKETYLERMKRAKEENTKTSSSDYPPYVIEPFHITTTKDDDDEKD